MKIRDEIRRYAAEEDKPVLDWLLDHYSLRSQWFFVARCEFVRHGKKSYQVHKVWSPTLEGRTLYEALKDGGGT